MALYWNSKYSAFMDSDGNLYGGSSGSYPAPPAGQELIGKPQSEADRIAAVKAAEAAAYAAPHPDGYYWGGNSTFDPENRFVTDSSNGKWLDPSAVNSGFGGILGAVGGAVNSIGSAITTPVGEVGEALRPYAPAIIGGIAGYGALGAAGLLGGATGSAAAPAVIDASGGLIGGEVASGAVASTPVTGGLVGGWTPIASGAAAGTAAAASGATTPAATSSATNSVLADSAANSPGYGASSAGAGLNATQGVGGAMTLSDVLDAAKTYAPLIGAVAGAAGSGSSSTSTTANKDPWAPAQAWMKANLGFGQDLQAKYAANPFSQFQQQAYNNSANLGNQFRSSVNGLIPQMNNWKPYQRTPQSQTVTPLNLGLSSLGSTSKPF